MSRSLSGLISLSLSLYTLCQLFSDYIYRYICKAVSFPLNNTFGKNKIAKKLSYQVYKGDWHEDVGRALCSAMEDLVYEDDLYQNLAFFPERDLSLEKTYLTFCYIIHSLFRFNHDKGCNTCNHNITDNYWKRYF